MLEKRVSSEPKVPCCTHKEHYKVHLRRTRQSSSNDQIDQNGIVSDHFQLKVFKNTETDHYIKHPIFMLTSPNINSGFKGVVFISTLQTLVT